MRHTEADAIRERLHQRLDELSKRAGKIENDLRKPRNPDWEDRATETENDEALESLELSTLDEAGQIRAALERVNAGTYGTCLICGTPVGEERLEAIPHAATRISCAS